MRRKPEGWSIVLAGFWNRMIFTPEWVGPPRLFPGVEIEARVALLPVLPLIYLDREVVMEISATRLVFRSRMLEIEATLLRTEAMAHTVLQALPETPVQAIGVNFGFREEYPPAHLMALFNDADDLELGQEGWGIGERKLTRRLTRGNEVLNLAMALSGQAVDFDFNFHTEVPTNAAALQAVAPGRVLTLRDAALALLVDVYHLQLEEENDND